MASRKPKRAAKAKPAPKPIAKKANKAPAAKKAPAPKKAPAKKTKKAPVAKKAPAKKANKAPLAKKANEAPLAKKAPVAKKAPAKKASKAPLAKKANKAPLAKKAPVAEKAPVAKKASASQSTPARDALSALAQKRAIKATLEPTTDGRDVVDAYMRDVDHPFKAEMEAVRRIILGASPKISERIKWNAPSFYYKEDLGAFNPRATEYAHLILLFPDGAGMQADDDLLEGEHKDRREVKFHGMDEVNAKKPALEKLIKRWVALRDR